MPLRLLLTALAVALAGVALAVATAAGAVHANNPVPRQRQVPLITYGQPS